MHILKIINIFKILTSEIFSVPIFSDSIVLLKLQQNSILTNNSIKNTSVCRVIGDILDANDTHIRAHSHVMRLRRSTQFRLYARIPYNGVGMALYYY